MSSTSFWRKLSRTMWDGFAPAGRQHLTGTRRAAARKTRLLVEGLEDRVTPSSFNADTVGDGTAPSGHYTLRSAIVAADGVPGSTVNVTVNDTVLLATELRVSAPMTINVATGVNLVVSGQNLVRDFDVATLGAAPVPVGVAVNFKATGTGTFTIENGLANGASPVSANGGGILAQSPLAVITLVNVSVLNNTATGNGGGVYSAGSLGVYSSTIDGNTAGGNGGGLWASRGMVIDSSTITDNSATNGGGFFQDGTTPVIITGNTTQTLIEDNTATVNGGGGWANFNISTANTNILENQAITGNGGGLYSANGNVTIDPTLVQENYAGNNGGGIWANRNIVSINSFVTDNVAFGDGLTAVTGAGGGLFSLKGNITVNGGAVGLLSAADAPGLTIPGNLIFGGNTAGNVAGTGDGGGMYSGGNIYVTSCAYIDGNLAYADGGGSWAAGNTTITSSFVENNIAMGNGGGVATGPSSFSTVVLVGTFVFSNVAEGNTGAGSGNGGGVYTPAGNIDTQETAIFLNVAAVNGGGLYDGGTASEAGGGAINLYEPTIIDHNTAGVGGGGVYIGTGGALTTQPFGATMFGITAGFLPPTACDPAPVVPYVTAGQGGAFANPSLTNDPNTIIISNNLSGTGGGGIDAESSEGVTLLNTWVFGNTATSAMGCGGGALFHNVLDVSISYSTFSGNVSRSACGGGIAAILDRGSGVEGTNSISIDDSTFAANSGATMGGAVYLRGVDAYFNHDTFNANQLTSRVGSGGVAIFADTRSNAFIENVLADDTTGVAHGFALLGFGGVSPAGTISSMGHNLSSDNSLSTVINYNTFNGDIANGVQGLSPLNFHGGWTPTYDLLAGGQAIGDGDWLGPIADQNTPGGAASNRPVGANSDVGSVQFENPIVIMYG